MNKQQQKLYEQFKQKLAKLDKQQLAELFDRLKAEERTPLRVLSLVASEYSKR